MATCRYRIGGVARSYSGGELSPGQGAMPNLARSIPVVRTGLEQILAGVVGHGIDRPVLLRQLIEERLKHLNQ